MVYEARITLHKKGDTKPDYSKLYDEMIRASFMRHLIQHISFSHILGGVYRITTFESKDLVLAKIKAAIAATTFAGDCTLFVVSDETTFTVPARLSPPPPLTPLRAALIRAEASRYMTKPASPTVPIGSTLRDILYKK